MRNRCRDARGQALPLLLIVLAMTMLSVVVIARAGQAAADAAQARTAADAAALAGAADGRRAAERVAESNGGLMLDYAAFGDEVEVVVRVGDGTARARAQRVVEWLPSGRGTGHE